MKRLLFLVLVLVFSSGHSQEFPSKSVRIIVPWPPGGNEANIVVE
jgi:tripartite-type tricarboxylate transporter receptor subunit TctC